VWYLDACIILLVFATLPAPTLRFSSASNNRPGGGVTAIRPGPAGLYGSAASLA
jgi:hypothetical protein